MQDSRFAQGRESEGGKGALGLPTVLGFARGSPKLRSAPGIILIYQPNQTEHGCLHLMLREDPRIRRPFVTRGKILSLARTKKNSRRKRVLPPSIPFWAGLARIPLVHLLNRAKELVILGISTTRQGSSSLDHVGEHRYSAKRLRYPLKYDSSRRGPRDWPRHFTYLSLPPLRQTYTYYSTYTPRNRDIDRRTDSCACGGEKGVKVFADLQKPLL